MRLAVWQGPSPAGRADLAFAALDLALSAAGAAGAIMLVAPEVYLPGYNQNDIPALAQPRDGAWVARLSALTAKARCGLVVGYSERDGEQTYNAAIALGPDGEPLAHYRKIQLYGLREKAIFTPGAGYVTFDLAGTKAAILICYDIEFAPHVAAVAAQGVTLLLVPTANMVPFTHVVRATVPAMAANYGVTIAYANYCGTEGDLAYVGGSLIAGPHGEVLAQAGEYPALLIVDVPPADPARISTQSTDFRKV
jgi:5-aminopentanamidase